MELSGSPLTVNLNLYNGGGMYLKKYEMESGVMIAVCDEELIGRKFSENGMSLEVSKAFYGGAKVTDKSVIAGLDCATIANLVGEKAITCAVEGGFIDEDCVLRIEGIPHAQMFRM